MKRWWRAALVYLALVAAEVFALFPFWWMITTSLKHQVEIFGGLELVPQIPTLDNFAALFDKYNFGPFLLNSLLVVAFSVVFSLLLGTPAAYALTKLPTESWLQRQALIVVLLVRVLPAILLVVPFYIVLADYGLLNTRLGLILLYTGLNTGFVIWLMQSFLAEIPRDIEEAALVDGDTRLSALRRIVLPLAAPGLAATAIFSVINIYNDFLIALTITSTPDAQTIPVGVSTLIGKIQIQWGPMAAAGVVGALPIILFALLVQRHFVRGLTLGAVK
ncbi:MAG: carbohydrate ABC transporter permease [Chloroflexi bacterium]|nr:MAG: carbohydrate ABC transporter permease [Chloroflexota bacterium]TME58541.1 MAG: carbohydrate ABC transporter permease [Chloroflexota bacterium]